MQAQSLELFNHVKGLVSDWERKEPSFLDGEKGDLSKEEHPALPSPKSSGMLCVKFVS